MSQLVGWLRDNRLGIALMLLGAAVGLIGAALGARVSIIVGAICALIGLAFLLWPQHKAKLQVEDLTIAEEDPRIYLKPLNAEFASLGFMAFEMSNEGQRVNPAQGITVQTIPCTPSVHFEYIDHLEANERRRVVPRIGDDIFPSSNILPELDKAWREAWERTGPKDSAMTEEAEFPFEIKIRYHDFRSRQFETTVSLRYCPVEDNAARRSILDSSKRREYTFLKVTSTKFRRLS